MKFCFLLSLVHLLLATNHQIRAQTKALPKSRSLNPTKKESPNVNKKKSFFKMLFLSRHGQTKSCELGKRSKSKVQVTLQ